MQGIFASSDMAIVGVVAIVVLGVVALAAMNVYFRLKGGVQQKPDGSIVGEVDADLKPKSEPAGDDR